MSEKKDLTEIEKVLEVEPLKALSPQVCKDFRAVRKIVMKEAHRLIREEKLPFKEAMSKSWAEVKTKCLVEHGAPV